MARRGGFGYAFIHECGRFVASDAARLAFNKCRNTFISKACRYALVPECGIQHAVTNAKYTTRSIQHAVINTQSAIVCHYALLWRRRHHFFRLLHWRLFSTWHAECLACGRLLATGVALYVHQHAVAEYVSLGANIRIPSKHSEYSLLGSTSTSNGQEESEQFEENAGHVSSMDAEIL